MLAAIFLGMAIDTPARIAVLGGGPIGLEAALYARFLGYDVDIYERGRVAEHVLRQGHVTMVAPFEHCRSSLGLAALAAQDASYVPPSDDELLTGHEWAERYLIPLSQTDLLADHLRLETEVLSVGKDGLPKEEALSDEERGDYDFQLLVRDAAGREEIRKADAVLDATGAHGNPRWPLLITSEPNFYVLGATSDGQSGFHLTEGLEQIRQVFAILGDREALDLYANAQRLLREAN